MELSEEVSREGSEEKQNKNEPRQFCGCFFQSQHSSSWGWEGGRAVWVETQIRIKAVLLNLYPDESLQFPAWWSETDYSVTTSQHKGWNWLWKEAIIPLIFIRAGPVLPQPRKTANTHMNELLIFSILLFQLFQVSCFQSFFSSTGPPVLSVIKDLPWSWNHLLKASLQQGWWQTCLAWLRGFEHAAVTKLFIFISANPGNLLLFS